MKTIIEDKFSVEKNGTSTFDFDSVLNLKTDEKWSLGAKNKFPRTNLWSKNDTSTFGFDSVLKLKADEKWSLGAWV